MLLRHKYGGKELERMYGLDWYNYGFRFMDPVGRMGFLTMDHPMAEKYYSVSPYAYCLNNPVRYVDPTGMFLIDYFDRRGNYIGNDGNSLDNRRFIIGSNKESREIRNSAKAGGTTSLSSLESAVLLPSNIALVESLDVLNRTISNGGLREESSLVMRNGMIVRGGTGSLPIIKDGEQIASTGLPALPEGSSTSDVETTIHSHPISIQKVGDLIYPQSAEAPSNMDKITFKQYNMNIIVGPLGNLNHLLPSAGGTINIPDRQNGISIYTNLGTQMINLKLKVINNILKH